MIRAALVDDEIKGRLMLRQLCDRFIPEVKIIGEASDAEEATVLVEMEKPDLVFLDIEMPNKTGIQWLKEQGKISFHVIFVTAYNQYAVDAFRLGAVDYLLKPLVLDDLKDAVSRILAKIDVPPPQSPLPNLLQQFGAPFSKLTLPTLSGYEFVDFGDILYLEGDRNYTHLYLRGKRKITSSRSLGEFEEILGRFRFFRIHKSYLINLDRILKYTRGEGGTVLMEEGAELDISRRRKDDFLDMLKG